MSKPHPDPARHRAMSAVTDCLSPWSIMRFRLSLLLALGLSLGLAAPPDRPAQAEIPAEIKGDHDGLMALAEPGSATAQLALGRLWVHGTGVPQDDVTAMMWDEVATRRGHPSSAQQRDRLAERMSEADIAETLRRANACHDSGLPIAIDHGPGGARASMPRRGGPMRNCPAPRPQVAPAHPPRALRPGRGAD